MRIYTIQISKLINGVATARVYRQACELVIRIPDMKLSRVQGFSVAEQRELILYLMKMKQYYIADLTEHSIEVDVQL